MTQSILLSENTYQLQNALCWHNCEAHWQAYDRESQWNFRAVAHLTLALLETLPLVSQIVSLIEMCIAWICYSCCAAETSLTATTPTTPAPSTSSSETQSPEERRPGQPPHGGPGLPPPGDGPSQSRPAPSTSSSAPSSAPAPSTIPTPVVSTAAMPAVATTAVPALSTAVPAISTVGFFPSTPITLANLEFHQPDTTTPWAGLYINNQSNSLRLCEIRLPAEVENLLFIDDFAMARPGMETPFQAALEWAILRRRNHSSPLRVIMEASLPMYAGPTYSVEHLHSLGLRPYSPSREEWELRGATGLYARPHLDLSPEAAARWNTQILTNPLLPETREQIQRELQTIQTAAGLLASDTPISSDPINIISDYLTPLFLSSQPSAPPAAPAAPSAPIAPTPPATTAAATSAPSVAPPASPIPTVQGLDA